MTNMARLVTHVQHENRALVGYPYPQRTQEQEYAMVHLPSSKDEFENLLAAVKNEWMVCSHKLLAALLTKASFLTNSQGMEVFTGDSSLLESWGITLRVAQPKTKTSQELEIYDGTWEEPPQ